MFGEFVFIAYAAVAYYFVACNVESFSNAALSGLAKVPRIGDSEAFAKLSSTIKEVVLPQRPTRVALASAMSLLAYPLVSLASELAEAVTYVLGFAALLYLSLSQNSNAFEMARAKLAQLVALVREKATDLLADKDEYDDDEADEDDEEMSEDEIVLDEQ